MSTVEKAVEQALKFLRYSDRTVHEMKQKLREKGFHETSAQDAISRLKRLGLLDDRKYAEKWIRSRLRTRPIGKRLIETQLRIKGVHPDVVTEALEPLYEEFTSAGGIQTLAERQAGRYRKDEPLERRNKLYGFLIRRGFDNEEARDAVSRVLSGSGDEDYSD